MTENLFTVKDISRATGYVRSGINLLYKQGKIFPCFKTNRLLLFDKKEFERIVERVDKYGKYYAFK